MSNADEIEWLMKCRKDAQDIVDKITLRIVKLQEGKKEPSKMGFKNGEKKEDIPNNRD